MTENGNISFRVRLKAYNSKVLIISTFLLEKEIQRIDGIYNLQTKLKGPIRLPVKKRYYSLLRSPHIDKASQEQFEIRRHKWILDIEVPKKNYINLLGAISFPPGVEISIFFNEIK
uniref:Ribosomal protein S10 n=1 Tax=Pseudellipsoidion edaphicum TaxID=1431838 RepID=A0A3R5QN80_9STRA|nr:ribosomal protein S10 [Pseudellipsoidion edaphicum]QAA11935.1 ribosomal protein S10 [Pseudellipsoidion edaphicum]